MLKILDLYILKQFIRNFLFGILCFVIIFILVDLFENLDKFIDKKLSGILIFQYYLYFIPEILKLITPVGMLLSTLFIVSRFYNYSEMTAINSAGISLFRFSLPLTLFGLLITIISIYFNGWVVPVSNSAKFNFERTYLDKNKIAGQISNLHVQDTDNHILFMSNYNESDRSATNASIQIFDKNNLSELKFRYDIALMKWDSVKNDWKLVSVVKRQFDTTAGEKYQNIDTVYASSIPEIGKVYLSPSQIKNSQLKADELKLSDLNDFINSMEESGQSVSKAKVDYYSKISFPFANIVVILFGVSLNTGRRKGGAALQFGISILIAFVYLGFIKISQTFGYNGEMSPVLTAWLANIVFLIIALVNIIRTNILWK